mgnify:CR=1 FL=1
MRILAIDPGLAACGWALWAINTRTRLFVGTPQIGVIETEPEGGPRGLDDVRRLDLLGAELHDYSLGVDVVVYERPLGMQAARAAVALGLVHGLIRGIFAARTRGVALVDVMPLQVKAALVGNERASKEEMIRAAARVCPGIAQVQPALREHVADAIGVAHALRETTRFRELCGEVLPCGS